MILVHYPKKGMTAMLDNPKGRDCNEMVGYQVRQKINADFCHNRPIKSKCCENQ